MAKAREKIMLVRGSYLEYLGTGRVPKMKLVGIVTGFDTSDDNSPFTPLSIDDIDKELRRKARSLGATHVFNVEYKAFGTDEFDTMTFGYGDAYKPNR